MENMEKVNEIISIIKRLNPSFEVFSQEVIKVNDVYTAISIRPNNAFDHAMIIDVRPYMNESPLCAARCIINTCKNSIDKIVFKTEMLTSQYVLNHIQVRLVNTLANTKFLKTVLHKEFNDLSIVLTIDVSSVFPNDGIENRMKTINLKQPIMDIINREAPVSFDQLLNAAIKNAGFTTNLMSCVMMEMGSEDVAKDIEKEEQCGLKMFVATNKYRYFGASAMLDTELLSNVSEELDCNLYILPCSIHEVLLIPEYNGTVDEITTMIRDVNAEQVMPKERLSDNAYFFNSDTQTVTLVGNVRELNLD